MITTDKRKRLDRITNYMEELTDGILQQLLSEERANPFSSKAVQDIKALALNRLWPMYTTTTAGREFLKKVVVEDKIEKDVVRELRAAIDMVRAHPRQ